MIQAVMTAPDKIGLGEAPRPMADAGEVRIRVKHICVRSSGIHIYKAPRHHNFNRPSKAMKVIIKPEQEK